MYDTIMIGQVISIKKAGGYLHFAIYAGEGTVVDCSPAYGVTRRTLQDFDCENQGVRNHGYWGSYPPDIVIRNALALIGQPYKLFSANCEHFVKEVCGLPRSSDQVRNAVFLLAIAGVVLFAFARAR